MAYKRRTYTRKPYKRTYKRRAYAKRRYVRKSKASMTNRSRSLVPNRYNTKLVYSDFFTTTTLGGGAISYTQWAMNGLYDPDLTGTGHQPMGFDQLCPTLYQSYLVTGCKMILEGRFVSPNLDTAPVVGNIIIGGVSPLSTTLPSTLSVANESRQYITVTRSDQSPFRIKKYFNVGKTLGIPSNRVKNEAQYSAHNSANPALTPFINVGFVNMDSALSVKVQWSITLVYYTTFFGPTTLVQS